MNIRHQCVWKSAVIAGAMLISSITVSYGQPSATEETTFKQYWADVTVFSFNPKLGIDSLRGGFGAGGIGPGGTFGTSVSRGTQRFDVTVAGRQKAERFLAKLTVKSIIGDKVVEIPDLNRELDLTDLQPHVIELARDDDGRVYRVNVYPKVREKSPVKTFHAEDLELDRWSFRNSAVILNDQDYVGTLEMSGGPLAWVDIPGFALVEFSLVPLKESQPEGVLKDGTININHGTTRVEISGVRNGLNQDTLSGSPYRVFVRWKAPSQSIEQYRESLKRQVEILKQQIESGDSNLPKETLSRLEMMANSGRVLLMSNGVRRVRKDELDDQPR